jgi:hypothetical protein
VTRSSTRPANGILGVRDVSLLEGPGVDRVAVAHQLEQAWLVELLGRPLVQALQPRRDHRVVEHPAEALLAARRNGRCRGARPVGPWNTCAIRARRAAGSSRTATTCSPATASAPAWSVIAA